MDEQREILAEQEWHNGYLDQTSWLAGKTLTEARNALITREATLKLTPYNQGGNHATQDYIEELSGALPPIIP